MISAFLSNIKDLIVFIWALQTFFWRQHLVAMGRKTRRGLINESHY